MKRHGTGVPQKRAHSARMEGVEHILPADIKALNYLDFDVTYADGIFSVSGPGARKVEDKIKKYGGITIEQSIEEQGVYQFSYAPGAPGSPVEINVNLDGIGQILLERARRVEQPVPPRS